MKSDDKLNRIVRIVMIFPRFYGCYYDNLGDDSFTICKDYSIKIGYVIILCNGPLN